MRARLGKLARTVDGRDVLAVLGLAAIAYGAAQYSPPLGLIIPGCAFLALALKR